MADLPHTYTKRTHDTSFHIVYRNYTLYRIREKAGNIEGHYLYADKSRGYLLLSTYGVSNAQNKNQTWHYNKYYKTYVR